MKTAIFTLAAVLTFGLLSYQLAFAGSNTSQGYGCGGPGVGRTALNTENSTARDKFYAETRATRKQLSDLRQEYAVVLNTDPVDKDRAEELWSEMFDLRTEIQTLAKEQGILLGGTAYCLGPNGYYEEDLTRQNSRNKRSFGRRSGGRWQNI